MSSSCPLGDSIQTKPKGNATSSSGDQKATKQGREDTSATHGSGLFFESENGISTNRLHKSIRGVYLISVFSNCFFFFRMRQNIALGKQMMFWGTSIKLKTLGRTKSVGAYF